MTKREKEILADIRNKFGSILSFFSMWDEVVTNTTLTMEQKQDIYTMIMREEEQVNKSAKTVADLLKSLG